MQTGSHIRAIRDYQETGFQKVSRKLKEEPLVPLGTYIFDYHAGPPTWLYFATSTILTPASFAAGTLLTCAALYNAWRAMRKGDHARVQRMFRARIGAQAFTVMAIVAGGAYYGADREKRKELIKLEAQQRAEERHQKWLLELEVRDEEEKALKEHLKRRKERVQAKKTEETQMAAEEAQSSGTDGPVPTPASENKVEGSSVLGALSNAGGWFGTGKGEPLRPEDKSTPADSNKK